jgi:lysine-arginine-ornithine-binding protein
MKNTLILILISFTMQGFASQLNLRIGTEGAYAPFNFIDNKGNVKGFDIDVAKEICKEIKANCTFKTQAWDGIIPGLLYKKYDVIAASMSITKKRQKKVLFTIPYYTEYASFFVPKSSKITNFDKDSLKGKTIGVQKGTIHLNYLEGEYKDSVKIKEYGTQEQANLDLESGRVDLVLGAEIVLSEWNTKFGKNKFELRGPKIADLKYYGPGAGIAFRKKDKVLKEKFDMALNNMKKDGRMNKIWKKYFPNLEHK